MKPTLIDAITQDKADEIAHLKNQFEIPAGKIYLDGNSLGPVSISAKQAALEVVQQQWGNDLISSWNKHSWIDLPINTGEKIAKLVGAGPGQLVCCDSISVNLFKILHCALQLNPERRIILSQQDNFPTDLYVAEGLQRIMGVEHCQLLTISDTDIENQLTKQVAVLLLTHVNFRSGKTHDIEKITRAAHAKGIIVIWDLAHSVGVLPLDLDEWQVDFAVGCGYKYLNGGPGAPAFIYAADRHQSSFQQPLQGWMGHMAPFDFSKDYSPSRGMTQFLSGTPPVISMSVLNSALDIFDHVSVGQIRAKAIALMNFFNELKQASPELDELELISPESLNERGSQLAYSHPDAYSICQNLIAQNVIADFRRPDVLRLGFSPLFLSFQDIYTSVTELNSIMKSKSYRAQQFTANQKVT
ncbi:MAG: kynureninase [Pseudohongiellaceae bacterium]